MKRTSRLAVAAVVAVVAYGSSDRAHASPAVDGTRNLSLGSVARGSSYGTNAALLAPSNMAFQQTFSIEPMYQMQVRSRTHGLGFVIMDSLNNPRLQLGLGYLFMRGAPQVSFIDEMGDVRNLTLSRFGHEAFAAVGVTIVRGWLAAALKPKYQYTSLRYHDDVGVARNAHDRLNAFGLDASVTANFAGWAALTVVGTNLTGNHSAPYTDERSVRLRDVGMAEDAEIDHGALSQLSDYPLGLAHGLSVFPLHHPNFSINFDGTYDFSTYDFQNHVRTTYGGSAEFVVGPVPLRFGTVWDGRGRGRDDDRVYIAGGVAFVRPPALGGVGVDVGFGFAQQVYGPQRETTIGFNLGIRIHPDL
jgi:hypothetical protein